MDFSLPPGMDFTAPKPACTQSYAVWQVTDRPVNKIPLTIQSQAYKRAKIGQIRSARAFFNSSCCIMQMGGFSFNRILIHL